MPVIQSTAAADNNKLVRDDGRRDTSLCDSLADSLPRSESLTSFMLRRPCFSFLHFPRKSERSQGWCAAATSILLLLQVSSEIGK
jgi:hypothetical protein